MKTVKELRIAIENEKARSAWSKGVKVYALELIEEWEEGREVHGSPMDKKDLLNGADSWKRFSFGGYSLIYDGDIAERLCTPSELKVTRNGERNPNGQESWLDVQTRALFQACNMIMRLAKEVQK